MAGIRREVVINIIGTILAAPILLGLSWIVSLLSTESGVYLTVSESVEEFGAISVVTIQAENSSNIGFDPLGASFATAGRLQSAGVKTQGGPKEPLVTADEVRWSGRLPAKSSLVFALVFKGGAPTVNSRTAFTASYASTDQQGFTIRRRASVRSASEAAASRLLLLAKWLLAGVALFTAVVSARYVAKRVREKEKGQKLV